MVAVSGGHEATVQYLADNGADINSRAEGGGTALMTACWRGYDDIVTFLLQKGADMNARNICGETALDMAANRDNYSACKHLLVAGADCKKIKKYNEQKIQHVLSLIDSQGDISNLWGNTSHI